jgi:hypothetical protein
VKVASLAVGVASIAIIGYTWLHFHDQSVREAAMAQRSRDSLVAAVATERAERAAQYTADSLVSLRALQARDLALRAARGTSDSLSAVAGRLRDSLELVTPDSLSPLVRRMLAAWRAENVAWLSERALADSALAARDARIAELESSYATDLAACDSRVAEALRQLDAALKRTNPGILTRVIRVLPWVGGALIVGRLSK